MAYTMYHFATANPDVHWSKELKKDELAESERWQQQVRPSCTRRLSPPPAGAARSSQGSDRSPSF